MIDELLNLLIKSGQLDQTKRKEALNDLIEREKMISTGMQEGIAFPHARTSVVTHLICAVGIKKNGIDFDSLDGKSSQIFFLTLSPKDTSDPQLLFMAEVSKILQNKDNRGKIISCKTNEHLYEFLNTF